MIDYQPRWLVLRRRARTPWHYIVTTPRVLAALSMWASGHTLTVFVK